MADVAIMQTVALVVDASGAMTLPAEILEALDLQPGDVVNVFRTEQGLFVAPPKLILPEVAALAEKLLAVKGLTANELLADLEQVGEALYREQYGDPTKRA
jgi:AbrB family looped-hinge helix DNA binding protein